MVDIRRILCFITAWQMSFLNPAFAQSGDSFQVRKDEPSAKAGGVYYSPSKKGEVLFKANIWGSVQYPGVHYLPLGTRFLDGVSIAGGPLDSANTEDVVLSTKIASGTKVLNLSVKQALANPDHNPILQPDDIVFVKEDRSIQRTQLYLAIGTFVLSAAAFGVLVSRPR